MPRTDPKLEKWIQWLETIQHEVTQLVVSKNIFWSVQGLIKQNAKMQKPSEFYWYLGDTYIAYAVMGVRRQIKNDPNSISLVRLLSEIIQEPGKISRDYHRSLYASPGKRHYADSHFDKLCHAAGDPHVSVQMVQKGLDDLKRTAKTCEDFADKRVAHRDTRTPQSLPKFKELDEAIDFLQNLCLKYRLVVLADCLTTLQPTYSYDWEEIFDYPWRLPEEECG